MLKNYSIYLLLFGLCLTACSQTPSMEVKPTESKVQHMEIEGTPIQTAQLGESCLTMRCGSGLECNENDICVSTVVDPDLVCPETQDPVCGLKDGTKNGYLNECEAKRHGAETLYKGFCHPDPEVAGNCKAGLTPIGNCDTIFTGWMFDGAVCQEKSLTGCEAEIPFPTKEACHQTCL